MKLFLIVYDRSSGKQISLDVFEPERRAEALQRRAEIEIRERARSEIEVVVLAAESLEALERTHSRYFKTLNETLSERPELR